MRGRKVTGAYLKSVDLSRFQGQLKHLKEQEIRRLIIKMLILSVFDEIFVQGKQSICVYIEEGRHASKLINGKFSLMISKGVAVPQNDLTDNSQEHQTTAQEECKKPPPVAL